jgi:hypothetical protein
LFGHLENLARWVWIEALDTLVLAYERNNSGHVIR